MRLMFLVLLLSVSVLQADVTTVAEMLAKAATLGDVKTVEHLLQSGVNPDLTDRYGETPLYYAAAFDQIQVAELLLASHADPNKQRISKRGDVQAPETPLQYAADLGNVHMASMLIDAGARINEKGAGGRTALHFAVGRLSMMQFLIEKGADVNTRDAEGTAPLDDAVWYGNLDAVAILLAHGARLNEVEPKTGAAPINEAAFQGNTALIRYLLRFNPDLTIPDKRGYKPLDNAIRRGKEETALLLLSAESKEQETPQFFERTMDAAIRRDEPALLDNLLQHGVSANAVLPSGATALDVAAFSGSSKLVRILLENKADPNASGRNGTSPLEDASLKGFDAIAAMLIEHGAQVNQVNGASGTTALYSAASFGKSEVVKLLLEHGANPNLCSRNHKSPYQAALENGFHDVASQIQSHGGAKSCER